MSNDLRIRITADGNDATATFKRLGDSSKTMGEAMEQAGEQGERALNEMGDAAESNAERMDRLQNTATALGAVMGALGSGVITAGSAWRDYSRQVDGITRIYGEHADQILEMTEGIQDFTRYSNDAARESALIASSLATNYDMSAEQIDQLIQRSADLAQIYGYDLPDAVQRTSAALRGEGESAEMLGLNLSDAAVAARALDAGITNWNVPGALSEAEKAAFRFQLLMQDTESTVGAAADAAGGAGGGFRRLINEFDDGVEAVGRFLGPIGEVGAEMAPIAMALPVVSAGIGRFATVARSGALASTALAVATNPVTLGLGALAVAGIATWNSFQDGVEATRQLEDALIQLGDVSTNLRLGYRDEEATFLDEFIAETAAVTEEAERLATQASQGTGPAIDYVRAKAAELGVSLDDVIEMYRVGNDEAERYALAQVAIGNAFANSAVDHQALDAALDELDAQWQARSITFDEYLAGLESIAGGISDFRIEADATTVSTAKLSAAFSAAGVTVLDAARSASSARAEFAALNAELASMMLDLTGNSDLASRLNLTGLGTDATQAADDMGKLAIGLDSVLSVFGQIDAVGQRYDRAASIAEAVIGEPGVWGTIDDLLNAGRVSLEQYNEAVEAGHSIQIRQAEVEENLNVIRANQIPLLEESSSAYADYVARITEMGAAEQAVALGLMDTGLQDRILQFADLGNQLAALGPAGEEAMQQVVDGIAATNPVLTETLDQLGLIEEQANGDYTINMDAVGAMDSISRLTESIDALTLALGGVPPLDIEVNADISEADATVRNWAQDGYTGGWGPVMVPTELEEPTIPVTFYDWQNQGAAAISIPAELDFSGIGAMSGATVMDAARQALGLIENAVTITVSQTGAEETSAAIETVTTAAAGVPEAEIVSMIVMGAGEAVTSLDAVTTAAGAIPEAEMLNVFVFGAFEATMSLYGVRDAALSIPESVSTTITTNRVTNWQDNYLPGTSILPGGRHGGTMNFAHGGVVFEAAEAGYETLHLAGGGVVPLMTHGLYQAPAGSYVSPHNAAGGVAGGIVIHAPVTVQGNVYGIDDLTETVMREMTPALEAASRRHARAMGGV